MKKITSDKAKEVLLKEQQENQKKCSDEVNAVLEKYGFGLRVGEPQIQLVPKK